MEDIHIINLFLERSEDAIRQVEVKYEKFCFKIAWNILYNTEDSEECVNDTWLITWNKIPPKTPTKLSAFLGKITRNLALDNFRKKNASKRADTHMMDICGEVEKLENTIKDYVEEDIKKKEILNILEKFLSNLKAGDRDILSGDIGIWIILKTLQKDMDALRRKLNPVFFEAETNYGKR